MRVLLDEQLPRRLVRELIGNDVSTVRQEGGTGLTNGELLRRAGERGFEVFLTADQSIPFQQNLSRAPLGVVVLTASSNKIEDLRPLVPRILSAIHRSRRGQLLRVP